MQNAPSANDARTIYDCAILGAGLSGLSLAFRLQQQRPNWKLAVIERDATVGGKVGTENHGGFVVERGPNGMFDAKPHMLQLCRDVGLGDGLIRASEGSRKNRFVFLNGELQQLPGGPGALLRTKLLSWRGKLRLLREPFRRKRSADADEESIAEFATRRFGPEAARVFIDALVTGIYAGDPAKLSVASCLPRLAKYEASHGSVIRGAMAAAKMRRRAFIEHGETPRPQTMWSFAGGLQVLIDRLRELLAPNLHTGHEVRRLATHGEHWQIETTTGHTHAHRVVLTLPAEEQAELLRDVDPALGEMVADIRSNNVPVVALGYRASDCPVQPDGFGYIAPQHTRRAVLGVQWCSAIYPGRAPEGCVMWRALCGGTNRQDVGAMNDEELLRTVHGELRHTMGVRGEPVFDRIVRWPKAIPQYLIGHGERVRRIHTLAAMHPGLTLAGSAYHGVALNDCAEQAESVAARLSGG